MLKAQRIFGLKRQIHHEQQNQCFHITFIQKDWRDGGCLSSLLLEQQTKDIILVFIVTKLYFVRMLCMEKDTVIEFQIEKQMFPLGILKIIIDKAN